ncbi:hypothetical protein ASG56_13900 [Rhodococcus sp. Leaf7]|uniref:hypothetical protein n=1 Tax=unclassified Rhodococcus (in: high G+C Gram-positive bacteria) TaxID=192944 RepID=UPI0006FE136D|nr:MULTISPECIES: hypothetical protein [unclassified Rhodococcus (in: high G+C Gram-positive bacteria)]KQU04435.1 hypothetical protein ASG56_13900 [Rhodococcus sp. Leaf7]KQU40620.1 hypothetical protein ASG64_13890 [Rhodococcus sp. Leaf247]
MPAVRVATDRGFAATVADSIVTGLDGSTTRDGDLLTVHRVTVPLPPVRSGSPDLDTWSSLLGHTGGSEDTVTVCVSEIPRRVRSRPVLAEIVRPSMVVIYVPSFGIHRVARRARAVTLAALGALRDSTGVDRPDPATGLAHWSTVSGHDALVAPALLGHARVVAGMIRTNRPWRLVPTLSGALAAATATSAFGLFYSSIWQMAASMSIVRLTAVSATALLAVTAWLIFPNSLWEKRTRRERGIDRTMYNLATLGTVVAGVVTMYAVLFLVVGAAAAVVISPSFLSERIGRSANVADYVRLAWLSASLGTVAGAVGSTVADQEQILCATFGHREFLRRRAAAGRLDDTRDHADS